jgi:hypothetical protein
MAYIINFHAITLDEYRGILQSADLVPSRRLLLNNIETIFAKIQSRGLETLADLQDALKTKPRLQGFAEETGIDEEYLKVLIREINSSQPKPYKLADFPDTPAEVVAKLAEIGIKNTMQLYSRVLTPAGRAALAAEIGVDEDAILRLAKLTDLSRIRWVKHTFAYVLLEAGYDTLEKVTQADPVKLYEEIKDLNTRREIYRGHIGRHDMELLVDLAKDVPQEMVF